MQRAISPEPGGWAMATLRWVWGAEGDAGWRTLFASTPATWLLLAIFSAVSISDMVLAGSLAVSGPVIERIGQSPAHEALGQVWRFFTTTLINAPETEPPVNALQHWLGNAFLFVVTAPRVERVFGRLRVVVLFVVATVSGAVAIYVGSPFYWVPGGGTSHAVYAFVGGVLVIAFARRRRSTLDAVFFGVALTALTAGTVATTPTYPTGTNVSHLAGFIAGVVITAVWSSSPEARRLGVGVVMAIVVIAGTLAAVRTADIRHSDLAVLDETPLEFAPVMVSSGFGSIWVTGGRATGVVERDEVVRIDGSSGRVLARIRHRGIGGLPVVTKDRVWVTGNGTVVAIDPTSDRVVSRIRLSEGAWPWSIAATDGALWTAVENAGEVIRIDLRTHKQTSVAVGARPYAVFAHGADVWATSYGGQTVSRLDADTGMVIKQVSLPDPLYHGVFLDGSLWVGGQPFVYRLEPKSLDIIEKIDVGGDIWTLAVDDRGNLLVPQRYARTIARIDPEDGRLQRRIEVGLRQPTSVVAIGDSLWVADSFNESIVRMRDL